MKTLYITDLDGTFLNSDAQVSARSAAIVSELSRRGALISVATARTPATVEPLLADTYTGADLVVMTGAALWNRPAHRYDDLRLLSARETGIIVDAMRRHGINLFAYVAQPDGFIQVYRTTRTSICTTCGCSRYLPTEYRKPRASGACATGSEPTV